MGTHFLPVKILGTSFQLKTDEDLVYLQEIVDYFQKKVLETQEKIGIQDPLKIAIIAGIVATDELYKEKLSTVTGKDESEVNKITENLIHLISDVLDQKNTLTQNEAKR